MTDLPATDEELRALVGRETFEAALERITRKAIAVTQERVIAAMAALVEPGAEDRALALFEGVMNHPEADLATAPALIMAAIEEVPNWGDNTALVTAHCHAYVLHNDVPDLLKRLSQAEGERDRLKDVEGDYSAFKLTAWSAEHSLKKQLAEMTEGMVWADTNRTFQIDRAEKAESELAQAQALAAAAEGEMLAGWLEMTGCRDAADLQDMAAIGRSVMERTVSVIEHGPLKGWAPADDPAEIVCDLANAVVDAEALAQSHKDRADRLACEVARIKDVLTGQTAAFNDAANKHLQATARADRLAGALTRIRDYDDPTGDAGWHDRIRQEIARSALTNPQEDRHG
jgi:hypothetical protein